MPLLRVVRRLVEAHLADPCFNVSALCQTLGMSQSQLHRRLIALSGMSPVHFLQFIRLHHAGRLLLEHPDRTIAEVAYDTGFNSPSYFSRLFSRTFGCSPSCFRNRHLPVMYA